MRFLRQNTATIVTVGPFYDKTDGVTIETGLTITNEKISATVDLNDGSAPTLVLDNVTGATSGTSNDLNYITNCDAGLMQLELAAANVNYVGRFFLTITDAANHVPVFHEFTILPANVYDSFILGTDYLQTHAVEITNDLITAAAIANGAIDANTFAAGAINAAAIADSAIDLATFAADAKTGSALKANVETITAGAITAAAIANGAIDNATFAADVGSTAYATNIIALAADKAIANAALATQASVNTIDDLLDTEVAAILADTNELQTDLVNGGRLDLLIDAIKAKTDSLTFTVAGDVDCNVQTWKGAAAPDMTGDAYARLGAPAGASVSADIAAIEAQTDDIGAAGAGLTGIPWNAAWDAEVQSEAADALNAYDPPTKAELDTGLDALPTAAEIKTAIESAGSHLDLILADTGTDGVVVAAGSKTGYTLSDAGVDAVWDRASSLTLSFETLLTRAYQMINNKMEVTDADGTVSLKNIGASGEIASGSVTDNSTTTTRLELTWA
jgi:hypothetical protein